MRANVILDLTSKATSFRGDAKEFVTVSWGADGKPRMDTLLPCRVELLLVTIQEGQERHLYHVSRAS